MSRTVPSLAGKSVVVIGNGVLPAVPPLRALLSRGNVLVAADGGARSALRQGITPHVVIGDLDSLSSAAGRELASKAVVIRHPREKDATDLELALDYVVAGRPGTITFVGVLGRRWDQTLANLFLLERPLAARIPCRIQHGRTAIFLVDRAVAFAATPGDRVSLVPVSGAARGVTTGGLRYPLQAGVLRRASSRGLSNVATARMVRVTVKNGRLLVFHEHQHPY